MSLRIKINSVFMSGNHQSARKQLECTCKVVYGSVKSQQKVGSIRLTKHTIYSSVPGAERSSQKSLYNLSSNNDLEETGFFSESLIAKTNDENVLVHKLNENECELKEGDFLEITCFKLGTSRMRKMRPFAKYLMLMDQLRVKSDKNSDGEALLTIEDFLIDPKNNRILRERIHLTLQFNQYLDSCRSKHYSIDNKKMKKFINASITPVTTIDFIKTIKKTGEFALKYLYPGTNRFNLLIEMSIDEEELVRKFIFEVGRTPVLLTLALSFVMKYELNEKLKANIYKLLAKNNPFSYWDFNSNDNSLSNFNQYFHLCTGDENITSWKVTVSIHEIKNLVGVNERVYCVIDVGDRKFTTRERHIDRLVFSGGEDETSEECRFISRIKDQSLKKAKNCPIVISVYFSSFYPFSPVLVGKFQTDFATVYDQPGHGISKKWGEILCKNTDENTSLVTASDEISQFSSHSEFSLKGYIKFDIAIQSDHVDSNNKYSFEDFNREDTEDIESNLFVPYGLNEPRQPIKLYVIIHHAFILVKKHASIIHQLKSNLSQSIFGKPGRSVKPEHSTLSSTPIETPSKISAPPSDLNPYVKVTFDGETKQTPIVYANDKPVWDHRIEFNHLYPPLVRMLRIQLCTQDASTGAEQVLASEFLTVDDISDYVKDEAYLPTYGPRYINLDDDLDDEPANRRKKKIIEDNIYDDIVLNNDLNPNFYKERSKRTGYTSIMPCNHIGRLLISIETKKIQRHSQQKSEKDNIKLKAELTYKSSQASLTELSSGDTTTELSAVSTTSFTVFALIHEVSMIDARFKKGPVQFQLCVGNHGYQVGDNSRQMNFSEEHVPIQLDPLMPVYLAIDKEKICLSLKFYLEDMRHFMLKNNYLQYALRTIIENYNEVKSSVWTNKFYHLNRNWKLDSTAKGYQAHKLIINLVSNVKDHLHNQFLTCQYITDFDKHRVKKITNQLTILVDLLKLMLALITKFENSASNENFSFFIDKIIKTCLLNVRNLLREPFNIFPDLNLFMLCNNQPVGVCIVKSGDVIWSEDELKMGCICAKMVYMDVKSLSTADHSESERENIARLRVFIWLGLSNQTDVIFSSDYLPAGYGLSAQNVNSIGLPTKIFFNQRHLFQLKCYLYQGRDMLMLDIAGCSDPFARISLNSQSVTSKTIDNTVNPTWNQTLTINEVCLYGDMQAICQDPPEVCVDAFDEDPFGIKEFMGRFYVKPEVNCNGKNPPKLAWYRLFFNYERAGDILASFELIHKPDGSSKYPVSKFMEHTILSLTETFASDVAIPESIKPKTKPYTLEILYWGIRNLKETNFMKIGLQKISLDIEIGDKRLDPIYLEHSSPNENFLTHLTHRKYRIEIPELDEYKPHLSIRCEGFGSLFLYNRLHKTLESLEKQFSKKILIGSSTIKTIGEYCYGNEKLSQFCKSNSSKSFLQSYSSVEDMSGGGVSGGVSFNANSKTKRYTKFKKIKERLDPDMDLEYLDYWTKYYAALNVRLKDMKRGAKRARSAENKAGSQVTDETDEEETDNKGTDKDEEIGGNDQGKKGSRRRIKPSSYLKLNVKSLRRKTKPVSKKNHTLVSTTNTLAALSTKIYLAKNEIQKVVIYENELEKNFDFTETLKSFNLLIGKAKREFNLKNQQQCQFKGNFLLYDETALNLNLKNMLDIKGGFLKNTPPNLPIKIKVHVYILKISVINSIGLIGNNSLQPKICLNYGSHELKLENIKIKSMESLIGKCFEFEARFPNESQLTISLSDSGFMPGWNDLIGQTVIDLEDRFYSNLYATCGLPKKYETSGYNIWRDVLQPQQILTKLCKKFGLLPPKYMDKKLTIFDINGNALASYSPQNYQNKNNNETDDSRHKSSSSTETDSNSESFISKKIHEKDMREQLALDALNDWKTITNVSLVPEHVETRSLYNPESGTDLEQGKIQMWIDMFPILNEARYYFKPVDISERKPKRFHLRIIVFNTSDVILDDENILTGEKSSDIYIKAFMCDKINEAQKTDIHHRSLDGEGNFNWRMIFEFDYLPAEKKIIWNHKEKLGFVTTERKMKPKLTIQCLDWDQVSADDHLGEIELNLCKLLKGCVSSTACTGRMLKDPEWPTVNLFKMRKIRGWWPFQGIDPTSTGRRPTGKVEVEFHLLTEQEALEEPAGLGREGPEALPEPVRPETSFLWLTNPMQTFRFIIWKQYWKQILLIFFTFILILIIVILVVQLPSEIVKLLIVG